jgi:hypothetical protein
MTILHKIAWDRVQTIVVLPALVCAVIMGVTDATRLIPALILMVISMATAVCVAFTPNMVRCFLKSEPLDSSAVVCLGIWLAWADYIYRPALQLAYRMFPSLKWVIDSDLNSLGLILALFAASCHLIAPAVVGGRIPSKKWAGFGAIAGAATLAGLTLGYWPEVYRIIHKSEPMVPTIQRNDLPDAFPTPRHLLLRGLPPQHRSTRV